MLTEFRTKAEEKRIATARLFGVENSLKARKGRFEALVDPALIMAKTKEENELRAKVGDDPALQAEAGAGLGHAFAEHAKTLEVESERYAYAEGHAAFDASLFGDEMASGPLSGGEGEAGLEAGRPEYTDGPTFRVQAIDPGELAVLSRA